MLHGLCGTDENRHTHDGNDSHCVITHVDMAVPVREKDSTVAEVTDIAELPTMIMAISVDASAGQEVDFCYDGPDTDTGPAGFNSGYIVRAIPPRAPSFTV